MAKKNETDIRIVRPDSVIYNTVKRLAKMNKRTMGKQAEFMLIQFIKNNLS